MSERAQKAAERIKEQIPIVQVLFDFGYNVRLDAEDREQQFSCDLHGDGNDLKASGRVYPETGAFFCFACGRSRDAIALTREKLGLKFWPAIKHLEEKYGLPSLPWEMEEEEPSIRDDIEQSFNASESPEALLDRVDRFLMGMTRERSLEAQKIAGLWETLDRVKVFHADGGDSQQTLSMAHKVLNSAKEALRPRVE